jgi:hypothetical protein
MSLRFIWAGISIIHFPPTQKILLTSARVQLQVRMTQRLGAAAIRRKKWGKYFDYALKNIKPTDAVIVGTFPKFSDQIAVDVGRIGHALS